MRYRHAAVTRSVPKQSIFTVWSSINFLEVFQTVDYEHKNVFSIFILDFLYNINLMSTCMVFKSSSITDLISHTGLKGTKERKQQMYL